MARLALTVAGGVAGALLLPGAGLGIGQALGFALGSMVGGISGSLAFPPEMEDTYGPRNKDIQYQGSTYGSPIAKLYGTSRLAGQVLWTSKVKEIPIETEIGGKGGPTATNTTYKYQASFSVGICVGGTGAKVIKMWADSKLVYDTTSDNLKLSKPFGMNFRFYDGNESQKVDPTEESYEGTGNVPAYRGICRIVFEDFDLTPYGGRYPNLNFEVTMNPTIPYPYLTFNIEGDLWGATQQMKLDSTMTYLYIMVDNSFSKINVIDNNPTFENFIPADTYRSILFDIAADGGWWIVQECVPPPHYYLGKTNEFVQNYRYVLTASGAGMKYAMITQVIDCGQYVWAYCSGSPNSYAYKIAIDENGNLMPLHPYTGVTAEPNFSAYTGEHLVGACYAPTITHDGETINDACIFIAKTYPSGGVSSSLYINDDRHDITAICLQPLAVGYEPDNGWIFVGATGGGGIVVFDSDINYVKTIPIDCYATSCFLNINNHRLWVVGPTSSHNFSEIDTLTGEVIRTLDLFNWLTASIGGMVYDPLSNAIWITSVAPPGVYKILLDRADPDYIHLWEIVQDIGNQVGLTNAEMDVSELTDHVWGYSIDQRMSARNAIEPLQIAYFFDGVESDAKIKFLKRELRTSTVTIDHTDLACHDPEAEVPDIISHSRQQEVELPRCLEVLYPQPNKDYQTQTQRTTRQITNSEETKTVTLPINLEADEAKQIAEKLLYLIWLERNRQRWFTYRKYSYLDNCDAVTLTNSAGNTYLIRITKMEHGGQGLLSCESVLHDLSTYVSTSTGIIGKWYPPGLIDYFGPTIFYFMDIPFLRDGDAGYRPEGFYVGLCPNTSGWRGAIVYKSSDRINFIPNLTGMNASKQGWMKDALVAIENPGTWDRASLVDVQLFNENDTLSSATEDQVLNGANPCVIGFEICQFCTATLVSSSPKVYTLSNFLRGRRGTEAYVYAHGIGERFVYISSTTIYRSDLDMSEIGLQRFYSITTLGSKLDTTKQVSYHGYAASLKPLSPVHMHKTTNDANDWIITWVRRTRIGGAWRDLVDVPLGESVESYQLDIFDDDMNFLRTETTDTTTYTYEAADQTTDGITPGDPIKVHIHQMSELVGRGFIGGDGIDMPPELAQIVQPINVPDVTTDIILQDCGPNELINWTSYDVTLVSGQRAICKRYIWRLDPPNNLYKVGFGLYVVSGDIDAVLTGWSLTKTTGLTTGQTGELAIWAYETGASNPSMGFSPNPSWVILTITAAADSHFMIYNRGLGYA